jgi:hypothetical protein
MVGSPNGGTMRILALVVVAGCATSGREAPAPDTTRSERTLSPCADRGWSGLADPDDAVHVRTWGDDATADGTRSAPFETPEGALDATRAGGPKAIFLGPGTYDTFLDLGAGIDDGLAIYGCSATEVTLRPDTYASGGHRRAILVSGAAGVTLADFRIQGGLPGLWIWQGATAEVSEVVIDEPLGYGVFVGGTTTAATLTDVEVHDVDPDVYDHGWLLGYGVAVDDATVTMTRGGVWGASVVGVLAANVADVTLNDVTVEDTYPDYDGSKGRGAHAQGLSSLVVQGGAFRRNSDAGIAAVGAIWLEVSGVEIRDTAGVPMSDGTTSGDGILLAEEPGGDYAAGTFLGEITAVTIEDNDRAATLLDGAGVEVTDYSSVTESGNGLESGGYASYAQNGAVVTGGDGFMWDVEEDDFTPITFDPAPLGLLDPE